MGNRLKKRITITLDPDLAKILEDLCKKESVDRSSLIGIILTLVLNPEKVMLGSEANKPANPLQELVTILIMANLMKVFTPFMEIMTKKKVKT